LTETINIELENLYQKTKKKVLDKLLNLPFEITALKKLVSKLLNTQKKLKQHILGQKPFPKKLIKATKEKINNLHPESKITLTEDPINLLNDFQNCTRKVRNKINNEIRKINNKKMRTKIDKLLRDPNFNQKGIFKVIEPNKDNHKIAYYIENGKLTTDPTIVKNKLKEHYEIQFSKITEPKNLDLYLNNIPKIDKYTIINIDLSAENIKNVFMSKENTSPGPDKIPYQMFKFLNSNNSKIFQLLSKIFQFLYNSSFIPEEWKKGKTILIPKENAAASYNNWRPITLLNTVYKVFTTIVSQNLQQNLKVNNYLPEEQCGFLPKKDTSTAILAFTELLKISNLMKYSLQAMYIDFEKAYDSVQHWSINSIMSHLKLPEKLIKIVMASITKC